ncbi:MAG: chromosome segregation protein SMC [Euryarchaeota archaeon]|nr:chromosome segregation protein SMC [Euryarchaeota archaeon]|tara:strand:- start:5669 stop:9550 length:3882 start_codon:yes stop_codon:yes gene_type:complete
MGIGMFLKALEMENFKSFRGEVVIPLDRGFSAITGPNGSGKSNCGDAIQFVLGPKSTRTIRAQNTKQLIFNGAEGYKPARGCTVTLVFGNPVLSNGRRRLPLENDEVRMTRQIRLTASDNVVSTYLLDGEDSSQKSFHRLLNAANARPDGYNIVLQGDVTGLARMTPIERRKVLDGVAGVTSYDDEIRKAKKQKESVDSYIERIGMLQEEQQVRLNELEQERKIAMKAQSITDELTTSRSQRYQAMFASLGMELEHQIAEQLRFAEEASILEEQVKAGSKKLVELDDRIGEIQKQIDALLGDEGDGLSAAIHDLRVQIDRDKDRIEDSHQANIDDGHEREQVLERYEEAEAALNALLEEATTSQNQMEEAQTMLDEAQSEEAAVRALLEGSGKNHAELNRALSEAIEALDKAKQAVAAAQSDVDRTAAQAELVEANLSKAQETAEESRLELEEKEAEFNELSGGKKIDRSSLTQNILDAERSESRLLEEAGAVERKMTETERQLRTARAELENKSNSKGMAGGAAAILGARDRGEIKGIIGTIAELCAPIDSEHETALATAFGGAMTSVVVDSDEVAAQAIRWLAQRKAGRATFLPLNKLSTSRAGGKAMMVARKPGVVGFAYELLEYDPRIDTAIKFALRNTLIVQNMDIARQNMGGVRLVTMRGDVTEAGGAMVGGSRIRMSVSFGGGIAGAKEVERLTAEIERLRLISDTVSAALADVRKEQQSLRQQINELANEDGAIRRETLRAEVTTFKRAHSKNIGSVEGLKADLQRLETLASTQLEALDETESKVADAEIFRASAQTALEDASPQHLKDRLHECTVKRTQAEGIRSNAEVSLRSISERKNLLTSTVSGEKERLVQIDTAVAKRTEQADILKESVAENETILAEKEAERAQFLEENKGLEDERIELVEERASLNSTLTQKASQARSHRTLSTEFERTIQAKRQELHELEMEMQTMGIEPVEDGIALDSVGDIDRRIRHLERRLEQFGAVNMRAIEQYDAVEQRLSEMEGDFKKLQDRKKHLLDVAERLEEQRKVRLIDVLEKVNENFKKVYKSLSNGGRGELYLENKEEPFKGGLELWAQPKGKSSNVTRHQLSGGEQSVAALALIFAIQDYDPSPFYYFDEVDQNLDSVNAECIAKMCRERSKAAQFIMVTLRKVSLQLADHHIGITHGGDGCSRRIIDFDQEQAIALGEQALKEAESAVAKNAQRAKEEQATLAEMPRVPDALPAPQSLGGLLKHMEEDESMASLAERTAETNEDIEERSSLVEALSESESEGPSVEDSIELEE